MVWHQQAAFLRHLKRYKAENNLTNAEVAPLIGLKPQSLQKYLYGNTRRPSQDVLIRAAELFKCPLADLFLDEATTAIPEGLDPVDRYRFDQILDRMNAPELTGADRQILFEDFMASYNRLVTLKMQMKK